MAVTHRPIPVLPACPRAKSIAKDIRRSYPTGRNEISRTFSGEAFEIIISTGEHFPPGVRANLVTTVNAAGNGESIKIPFQLRDEKTLTCRIMPQQTGLYSFWTQFSIDDGTTWLHDPVPDAWVLVDPPQVNALRMYTLIPAVSGTISDWSAELDRIKALGFNAVHFLPLTSLDASRSPYAAKSLFDVDPSYVDRTSNLNGLQQLEALIEKAKNLNISLCFDLVLNHIGVDSDMAKQAAEWIVPDESSPDGSRRARYWCDQGWQPWSDLVLINFEHASQRIRDGIWNYMQEYALFWAKYASETNGFVRFDNLHSSGKSFVDALTLKLREAYPNIGVIAEYFTDVGTLLDTIPKWGLSLILATPWDQRFVQPLREYLKYIHSISDHVRFFMPISSHDSGTPTQEFGTAASTIPRYIAAALMGTGATGITQGVEWGQPKKIEFIGDHPKITHDEPAMFGAFLRKVNGILAAEPAFRTGQNVQFVDDGHHAVIAVFRPDTRPGHTGFLVVCSFDIMGEQAFEVDLSAILNTAGPIKCIDLLTDQSHTFPTARLALKLPACGAYVLKF